MHFIGISYSSSKNENDSAKIKQSEKCTPEEIDSNIQCFQEIPDARYEVPEGSTATLRCTVRNQHGKVQWRAVPVLLGYDRNIPGRPRYRYVGSVVKGEHDLEIRDLRKEDSGMYECQVQPVGEQHPLLRRKTELVVLIRPNEPEIFYKGSKPIKDTVTLNTLSQEIRIEFFCVSCNGHPNATFKWFINNTEVRNGVRSAQVKEVDSTKSKMSYLTRNLRDADVVNCQVSNRATLKHHDPDRRYMNKIVNIVINSPPGKPVIDQITKSQGPAFIEGDVIRGTCKSSPPGKPAGSIVWLWKYPRPRELQNFQRENFTQKDVSHVYYKQQIDGNVLISTIELPPLTSQYHGAQLICEAVNTVTAIDSSPIEIRVKYPPGEVKISTSDNSLVVRQIGNEGLEESVIQGESGEQKTITCTTAKFYNEAVIKWQLHQSPSTDVQIPKKFSFAPKELMWQDGNSFRRNSTIKITFNKQLDKSYLDCQAWSEGKQVDSRVKLDIIYPPEKPIISGYHKDSPVRLNHIIDITCTTLGGNPLPELQWFKDNQPLQSLFTTQQIGNQKSLKLQISPSKSDNKAKYHCQATSKALKRPSKSDDFRLKVFFPPTSVRLSSLSGPDIEEGTVLTLQCLTNESNPAAEVVWKFNRCGQMMMELGRRTSQKRCDEEILSSNSTTLLSGDYGGKKVRSRLEIRPTWKDHMDFIDCNVYNKEYLGVMQVLSDRFKLNVTFSPKFDDIIHQNIVIEENNSKTYTIEPIANPRVHRYRWLKNSVELGSSAKSVIGSNAQFIINKASPTDTGNYTLLAMNSKGESQITIYLNVTYQPIISGNRVEVVVSNSQNANLECAARANPANAGQAFRWMKLIPARGFNDISKSDLVEEFSLGCNETNLSNKTVKAKWTGTPEKSNFKYFSKCNSESQFEMKSTLMVYHVDRNDVAFYKCVVNNRVGGDVTKTIELIRYFTPQILSLPNYAKAAGSQGEAVTLTCYMRAEPKPTISWFFGKYNVSLKANQKYRLSIVRQRPGLYMAQMTLTNIQRSDHGTYFCKAENEKGSDTRMIEVSGSSPPDVPIDVQVTNRTLNSITISWVQGFDGGSSQTFQVRWKTAREKSNYNYEDVASDETKTILELQITGLKASTTYRIDVNSRNPKHGNSAFSKYITASTLNTPSDSGTDVDINSGGTRSKHLDPKFQDNTVLFIVAATVFGFVILVVNVLVIVFVLRRRRQRSRTAKLEARYNNPKSLLAGSNGMILGREDHLRDSNSNFLRGDAVELYPRGLDMSQMSHHPHHLHSLRRSIPDDQKTFSSFETGSDDAREDLIRRQKEFGCCGVDPNSQKGSIILTYDPITNASYYTPVGGTSSTPIYLQNGMYDQDTLSTLLSPIHEGGQRQQMSYMNMMPFSGQRNSSSCGSINSGGVNSNGPHPPGHYIVNNISPCGSIIGHDSRNINNYTPEIINHQSTFGNGANGRQSHDTLSPPSSSVNNNAPYRARVVSPSYLGYGMSAQQREAYANELRRVQMSGNIVVNPSMFSRSSATQSPQILINSGSLMSSPINHINLQGNFDNLSHPSNTLGNRSTINRNNDSQLNCSTAENNSNNIQFCQKYRCADNPSHSTQQATTEIVDNSTEYVNSAMEDSTYRDNGHESQLLPRPNLV